MIVRGPSIILSARVASMIERALTDAEDRARRDGTRLDAEVAETLAELHDLADWWRTRQTPIAAAMPNGTDPVEPIPDGWLDMAQVATRMDCPPRTARYRVRTARLGRKLPGGRWAVDPDLVDAYLAERAGSA